jgi:hypothetical protein
LANGVRHNAAVVHLKDKFQVCRRQAERYVAAVYKLWREQDDEDRRLKMKHAIARRQEVFFRALKKGDYASANKALDALERMEGIAPEILMKLEHTTEVTQKYDLGEDLVKALEEVMKDQDMRRALANKIAPPRDYNRVDDAIPNIVPFHQQH